MGKKKSKTETIVVKSEQVIRPANPPKRTKIAKSYGANSTNDLFYSWTTTPTHSNSYVKNSLQIIRARSREQYRTNDYIRRFVSMCKNHIVGDGFKLQAQVVDPNGQADIVANDAIESGYEDFSRAENFSYNGKYGRAAFERLLVATVAVDGEAIVVEHTDGKYGLQYELIDAEWLDLNHNEDLPSGNFVRMGIEYNITGTVEAYHIISPRSRYKMASTAYYSKSLERLRVPASRCYHIFDPEFVEQDRGMPWTATALASLKMLDGWLDASLVAARVGASKLGIITTPTGDGYVGEENADGEVVMDGSPGGFEQLPPGYDIKAWEPEYPKGESEHFTRTMLRKASSGLNVNYATFASDLSDANFSSMRHGVIEEREMWMTKQNLIIESFCEKVYQKWIESALLRPGITIPGGKARLRAENVAKYRRVKFSGRRWDWVDPRAEMDANQIAVEMGLKSRSAIIRKSGEDPIEVGREIEAEKAYLGELNGRNQSKESTD